MRKGLCNSVWSGDFGAGGISFVRRRHHQQEQPERGLHAHAQPQRGNGLSRHRRLQPGRHHADGKRRLCQAGRAVLRAKTIPTPYRTMPSRPSTSLSASSSQDKRLRSFRPSSPFTNRTGGPVSSRSRYRPAAASWNTTTADARTVASWPADIAQSLNALLGRYRRSDQCLAV
jgi:hypothetical protein